MLIVLVFLIKAIYVWKEFSCICFVLSIIGDQQIKGFELACYTKIDITEKIAIYPVLRKKQYYKI